MSSISAYSKLDRIICINLANRTDKRSRVTEVFNKLKIPVQFFTAQRHSQGGRYGCFNSHINVIKQAFDDGLEHILIFEDDVVPSPSYSERFIQFAVEFLIDTNNNVDILQLGYYPIIDDSGTLLPLFKAPFTDKQRRMMKFTAAGFHAYCLTRSGMSKILSSEWQKHMGDAHFDMYVVGLQLNGYCCVPTLFEQNSCLGTDNLSRITKEKVGRIFQCTSDRMFLLHKISILKKYALYIPWVIALWIIIVCSVLLFVKFKKVLMTSLSSKS
jgi:glycosyl transferase family 25